MRSLTFVTAATAVLTVAFPAVSYAAFPQAQQEVPPTVAAATPALETAIVTPTRIAPGKAVKVTYRWQAVPLDVDYAVFVHIVGPSGATVSQDDHNPPTPTTKWTGAVTYTRTMLVPANLPDGMYKIVAGLYTALPNNGGWKNLILRPGKGVKLPPGVQDQYEVGSFTVDHAAPPPPPDSDRPASLNSTGYKMTFNEDFDTLSVSEWGPAGIVGTRWIAHKPDGLDFGDARFTAPSHDFPFTVKDGLLRIEARKTAEGWKGGILATCDPQGYGWAQKYGYFEMRAKFPKGPGTWPAFWMLSQHHLVDRAAPDVEIDVVEQYGHAPGMLQTTLHQWNPGKHEGVGDAFQVADMTEKFHRYGVLWDAKNIIWYFDGVELFRQPTPPTAHQPMYPLINLALGGGWPIQDTPNPSYLLVDYVRAWSKDTTIGTTKRATAKK